jgi:hypothetical protein
MISTSKHAFARHASVVPWSQVGSRVRTKAGEFGRVMRLDAEGAIAYVQLDDDPATDGTPDDVAELELIAPR